MNWFAKIPGVTDGIMDTYKLEMTQQNGVKISRREANNPRKYKWEVILNSFIVLGTAVMITNLSYRTDIL